MSIAIMLLVVHSDTAESCRWVLFFILGDKAEQTVKVIAPGSWYQTWKLFMIILTIFVCV